MSIFTDDQISDFKEAFHIFSEGKDRLAEKDFCTVVRATGLCPSENDLKDLLEQVHAQRQNTEKVSNPQDGVSFDDFLMVLSKKMINLQQDKHLNGQNNTTKEDTDAGSANVEMLNLKQLDKEYIETQLLEAFKVFDTEGNGRISSEHLLNMLTTLGEKLSEKEAKEFIDEADPNRSGYIDYRNFIKNLLSY